MSIKRRFFVLGYPRSRTAWLSIALSNGANVCLHEATVGCRTLDDVDAILKATGAACVGISDSGLAFLVPQLVARWPDSRLVVVTRDTEAVKCSIRNLGLTLYPNILELAQEGLDYARAYGALTVPFDRLGEAAIGRALWSHCVGDTHFDADRWTHLDALNIQVRMDVEIDKSIRHHDAMRMLYGERYAQCVA